MNTELDDMRSKFSEERRIRCPYCEKVNYEPGNPLDIDLEGLITYFGEDGAEEFECVECEKTFLVEETVDRTWEVTTI